jgi:hypothetical protein
VRKLVRLIGALALAVATMSGLGGSQPVGAAPPDFSFKAISIPDSGFTEPSVAVGGTGTVFICGPTGFPTGAAAVVRTTDGKKFERQDLKAGLGGGDCDVKTGSNGEVLVADLQVVGSAIHKSTDDGKSYAQVWTEDPVEQDRQWLAIDPDSESQTVYFAYHDFASESEIVAKSTDGGQTFPIHTVASNDPTLASDTVPNTFSGPIRVDPSNTQRIYLVYGISSSGRNAQECQDNPTNCPFGPAQQVIVARSEDGGLTWTDHVAMTTTGADTLGNIFPWITIDRAGNLYVVAAGNVKGKGGNGYFYTSSSDHGDHWSKFTKINKGNGVVVFPTIVAGSKGVADLAWLQSNSTDQNDPKGVWRVHFAQTRNGTSSAPKFRQVTGPVVRHGQVCTLGVNCSGGRQLGDFFEIALDANGLAHMAVASTEKTEHVIYWHQTAGPRA